MLEKSAMIYNIEVCEVKPQTTAVACGRANVHNIGDTIGQLLSSVWNSIKSSGIENMGRSVVLYWYNEAGSDFFSESGVPIEVGALVSSDFSNKDDIVCSTVPGGLVATTTHTGPYQDLPAAHQAIHSWCRENGYVLSGVNWEVYGHHVDDPAMLQTEVFYLVKDRTGD
jgi:effector-binding domain-containing protein